MITQSKESIRMASNSKENGKKKQKQKQKPQNTERPKTSFSNK